jgi:hypothetical protein
MPLCSERFPRLLGVVLTKEDVAPPVPQGAYLHREVDQLGARSLGKAWHTAFPLNRLRWGELQMDWLRSEDLKEEKVVTTPQPL